MGHLLWIMRFWKEPNGSIEDATYVILSKRLRMEVGFKTETAECNGEAEEDRSLDPVDSESNELWISLRNFEEIYWFHE